MALLFTLGGIDYTHYVDINSIRIRDSSEARGDSMAFNVIMDATSLSATPGVPRPGQIVSVTADEAGVSTKQFEGVVLDTTQTVHQSRDNYLFACKASSYTYILASKLVTAKAAAGFAGDLVRAFIAGWAPGFGSRYVRTGYSVPADEFDHSPLSSVFNKYAQAIGYTWWVDFDREVHFDEGIGTAGPIAAIDLDTENRLGGVIITEDISQIKNRVYIKDATSRSTESRRDTFVADGYQSFFRLFSPPFDINGMEVFKNQVPVAVFEDTLTSQEGEVQAAEGTCFVCLINAGLRFPLNDIPEEGDVITADYFPEDGGGADGVMLTLEDSDSIRMMRQRESSTSYSSTGVHETTLSVPEMRVETLDPLSFLGGIILDRSAWPEIAGSFVTTDSTAQGWKAGQTTTLSSTKRNLYNAKSFWRQGVKDPITVYINGVDKTFQPTAGGLLITEEVSFSSVPARMTI